MFLLSLAQMAVSGTSVAGAQDRESPCRVVGTSRGQAAVQYRDTLRVSGGICKRSSIFDLAGLPEMLMALS